MHARQDLREVAIALIGDDDRGAGLGDQEVGAGDADIGGKVFRTQHAACLVEQRFRFGKIARCRQMGVDAAEIGLDLFLVEVHGRRDDMARMLVPELDDVFAEIGLDRPDAMALEEIVERDLLGDHRLALGYRAGVGRPADVEHDGARLLGRLGPVHLAARLR